MWSCPNITTGGNRIYAIKDFLVSIYTSIESGDWSSTNSSDFFQVACWHPYLNAQKPTFFNWVESNTAVHNVMVNHGDGDKPVAKYLDTSFHLAWENFRPWLKTIYWFRLIDPDPDFDRDLPCYKYGFGLVKTPVENYTEKLAANAYREAHKEVVQEVPSALILLLAVFIALVVILAKKKLFKG